MSRIIAFLFCLGLIGCSPSLNWRQVDIGDMQVFLPCKPDRAQRSVTFASITLPMRMAGCKAEGALFAVSHVQADSHEQARTIAQSWQAQSLSKLNSVAPKVLKMPASKQTQTDESVYWHIQGIDANRSPVQAQLLWKIKGKDVYHWAVYADLIKNEHLEPMFEP